MNCYDNEDGVWFLPKILLFTKTTHRVAFLAPFIFALQLWRIKSCFFCKAALTQYVFKRYTNKLHLAGLMTEGILKLISEALVL